MEETDDGTGEAVARDAATHEARVVAAPAGGYRKAALRHYTREVGGVQVNVCVVCGFGVQAILEVAHLDQDRKNNALENLAVLCPNCHKMHDIGLIPSEVVKTMREQKFRPDWGLRIKDAGKKAAKTRRLSSAAKKAWATRMASKANGGSGGAP